MNEQTKKLDRLIEPILIKVYDMGLHSKGEQVVRMATLEWAREEARKACKEAGLKFVLTQLDGKSVQWLIKEIELEK